MATYTAPTVRYRFDDFLLDTGIGVLLHKGQEVQLRRQSYEVLLHLVENSSRLVSREELMEVVWAKKVVTDASITQCLVNVRAALNDTDHQKIRTLPGRGYRFELAVERQGCSPAKSIVGVNQRNKRRTAVLLGVIAVLVVGWIAIHPPGKPQTDTTDKSIIVLPFKDLSQDEDQAYLANGIAEELLNLLAQMKDLRVISRTTSWTFMDHDLDVAEIRRRLNVSHILEGSVRKSGNRVRVTVQLIDARSDSHIWSKTYDQALGDVFAIQDEISASVIEQLHLDLLNQPPVSRSIDPLAYEHYLKGRHLTHTVRTPPAFEEAVELLSQAVEIEPGYVPALWSLARALWNSRTLKSPAERTVIDHRISELIDRMVELAPESNYTNGWLAFMAEYDGEIETAARHWEQAVAPPGDASTVIQRAHVARFLGQLGRIDEALALAHYVVNRDPACSWCVSNLFNIYFQSDEPRQAALELEKLLEWREPTITIYTQLGFARLAAGEPKLALELAESHELADTSPGMVLKILAYHDLGEQDSFDAAFKDIPLKSEFPAWDTALISAQTDQHDLAFASIERAIESVGPDIIRRRNVIDSYLLTPIKADPRWRQLRKRHGIKDVDLSTVRFNPEFPVEVERLLALKGYPASGTDG